jgi:hypothetical protein
MQGSIDGIGRIVRALGGGSRGRVIWGATAAVAAIALLVCTSMQSAARDDEIDRVETRAQRKVRTVLTPALSVADLATPIVGRRSDDLQRLVRSTFLANTAVSRVRIWRPNGELVFSTRQGERSLDADPDTIAQLQAAADGTTTSVRTTQPSPREEVEPAVVEIVRTIVPIRVDGRVRGAAELSTPAAVIDDASAGPWRLLRIGFGIVLLAAVLLLYVAVRWPPRPDD